MSCHLKILLYHSQMYNSDIILFDEHPVFIVV